MSKNYHLCIDVRGALANWKPSRFRGLFTDDVTGRSLSAQEAKAYLLDELAKGHKVIPCSDECEGFDYSGPGCPGHESREGSRPSCPHGIDLSETDCGVCSQRT